MNTIILGLGCMAAMSALMLTRRRAYCLSLLKSVILIPPVAAMGFLGTKILYFIENGEWSGMSFFGAVLFFPVLLLPIAKIGKMGLSELLDLSTPPGLSLLAIFKLNCHIAGCCGGIVLWYTDEGKPVFFPSQLTEMAVSILLVIVLLVMEKRGRARGKLYPYCLLLYGTVRFIINWYRWDKTEFFLGLPAGNFWALCSIIMGSAWLVVHKLVYDQSTEKFN